MIKYKDLSVWLKVAIVFTWIQLGLFAFYFLLGFLEGLAGI